ncbi:MAG: hypothetical protein Q7S92_04615 [Candidatus Diapherotrites archaeon]|nr:hypothetical protein [Candidatus Diapherotrites archaeon]
MDSFNQKELKLLKSLNSPKKIQDFINKIPINFDYKKGTCYSPRMALEKNKAQCMEGAMLAAAALEVHGFPPLLMDLTSTKHDFDHVVAIFKQNNCWGAISKTNHAVLRYREPIYKTIRELAFSYFHEYFLNNGKKTLRSYSGPVNLNKFNKINWRTSSKDVWDIPNYLGDVKHFPFLSKQQIHSLRKADKIEIQAGKLIEWKK